MKMNPIALILLCCSAGVAVSADADTGSAVRVLTMDDAADAAIAFQPRLRAAHFGLLAAEAEQRQAYKLPNPEIEVEAEELGAEDGGTASISVSQAIELGGKRKRRRDYAAAETDGARIEEDVVTLELQREARMSFVDVVYARAQLEMMRSLHAAATGTVGAVSARVEAGELPETDRLLAKAEAARMRVEVSRREQALELRRAKLARLCGLDGQSIECKMEFETVHRPHSADRIKSSLDNHPRMRAARQALRRAEARILLATAERIPDLEVRLGVERDRLEEETTGLAALAMPLPVFDRREGAIAAARSLRDQAEAGVDDTRLVLEGDVQDARMRVATSRQTVSMLRDEIVPAHHAAAKATVTAYQLGQADLTALQQARRRVLEAEDELNGALSDWHRAWIDLEHAAGTSLPTP